jgi:hypothetical protein
MNREELVKAVDVALNFGGAYSIGYDCNFDVVDLRGALRALCAYAGIARNSPPSDRRDVVIVDRVETGEIIAGCSRADIQLVRQNCDGDVDREHLCEILRKRWVTHNAETCRRLGCLPDNHKDLRCDLLGCFTVASDGHQDLDDLAALFVDGVSGATFFDYSLAPDLAIDMNPMLSWQRDPNAPRKTWRDVVGNELCEGRKIGHAWKYAVFADLRGRIPGADAHVLVAKTSLRKVYSRGAVWA